MTRRRKTSTRLRGLGWNDRVPGRRVRRTAAQGGSIFSGFIAGISALWATPAGRRGRGRIRSKTVRRRS